MTRDLKLVFMKLARNNQKGLKLMLLLVVCCSLATYSNAQPKDYSGKDIKGIEAITAAAVNQDGWRKEAYERINSHRKADLSITIKDAKGNVLPNTEITLQQTAHEFPFGMVVSSRQFFGDNSKLYREILPYFGNKLGLENALKQRNGPQNANQTEKFFSWAKDNNLDIRGHCLIWPHGRFLPRDVEMFVYGRRITSYKDHVSAKPRDLTPAEKQKLRSMVNTKVAKWAAKWDVTDWDVVNETRVNHHLMDILGKEVMVDWFKIAKKNAVRSDAGLIINENQIITGGPNNYEEHIEKYIDEVQFLVDNGAPITGIGFQARMNWDITAEQIWERLNRFDRFGLNLTITEMEAQRTQRNPDLFEYEKAELIEMALTTYFSHPLVDQIFQWDFMATTNRDMDQVKELSQIQRRNGRSLVLSDGTLKLNGKIYLWLINNHWRTNETIKTDGKGQIKLRGFKGTYVATAKNNGGIINLGTLKLSDQGLNTELVLTK